MFYSRVNPRLTASLAMSFGLLAFDRQEVFAADTGPKARFPQPTSNLTSRSIATIKSKEPAIFGPEWKINAFFTSGASLTRIEPCNQQIILGIGRKTVASESSIDICAIDRVTGKPKWESSLKAAAQESESLLDSCATTTNLVVASYSWNSAIKQGRYVLRTLNLANGKIAQVRYLGLSDPSMSDASAPLTTRTAEYLDLHIYGQTAIAVTAKYMEYVDAVSLKRTNPTRMFNKSTYIRVVAGSSIFSLEFGDSPAVVENAFNPNAKPLALPTFGTPYSISLASGGKISVLIKDEKDEVVLATYSPKDKKWGSQVRFPTKSDDFLSICSVEGKDPGVCTIVHRDRSRRFFPINSSVTGTYGALTYPSNTPVIGYLALSSDRLAVISLNGERTPELDVFQVEKGQINKISNSLIETNAAKGEFARSSMFQVENEIFVHFASQGAADEVVKLVPQPSDQRIRKTPGHNTQKAK